MRSRAGMINLGSGGMTQEQNIIVISATGYQDLTLTVSTAGNIISD